MLSLLILLVILVVNMFQRDGDKMGKPSNPINLVITDFQQDRVMFIKATWDISPSSDIARYLFRYRKTTETDWEQLYIKDNVAIVSVETLTDYVVQVATEDINGNLSAFTGDEYTVSEINLSITRTGGSIGTVTGTDPALVVEDLELSGTVSITSGDATVTGSGTDFLKELREGHDVKIDGNVYTIDSITTSEELELTTNALTTASDEKIYLANMVLVRGDVYIQKGKNGIMFPDTGWKIIDDDFGAPQVLRFQNVAGDTDFRLTTSFLTSQLAFIKNTSAYKIDISPSGEVRITTDGDDYYNGEKILTAPKFEEGETYYRYDVVSFKDKTMRFLPADKDVTERYHPDTSVGQTQNLFNLFEFQEFGSEIRMQLSEANCLDVTTSTTIAFTSLSGLTITAHYGSCAQPTISGNNVVFSDTGTLTAFRFSNGQWIVTEQGTGTTAWNVGDIYGDSTTGNGTISNGTWGTDDIYSYNWNYGCNDTCIPALIIGTECANGTAITKPFVYGQNNCGVDFEEYEKKFGTYGDQTGSRSLTKNTQYSLEIDTSGTGGLKREFPTGIEYWDEVNNKIDLPNHFKVFDIRYTFKFNAAVTNAYVKVDIQRDVAGGRVLYESPDTALYGLKVYITPTQNGTISEEGIVIIRR